MGTMCSRLRYDVAVACPHSPNPRRSAIWSFACLWLFQQRIAPRAGPSGGDASCRPVEFGFIFPILYLGLFVEAFRSQSSERSTQDTMQPHNRKKLNDRVIKAAEAALAAR